MSDMLSVIMLNRVLLPGIGMRLPMVHTSHLDLIRDCQRNGISFGCCLQLQPLSEHEPSFPALIGTEALIADFGTLPDGMLYYRLIGGRRFRIRRTLYTHESVYTTEVDWFAPEPDDRLQEDHLIYGYVLQSLADRDPDSRAPLRAEFDHAPSACWRMMNRMDDMAQSKQLELLEIVDAHERLTVMKQWFADTSPSKPKEVAEHEGSEHQGAEPVGSKDDAGI